ncbi:dTDP-glucose 4,6-dehydratase [Actinoplanes cyaneus]|uniref:dTDP-glucose 4,6-dehydratase n=1 Tax=Actinoplanes cyaneus TaxID=52696 RepID=A0A919ME64_9ACTN|nr:NAD(P)-dependent oxidoreductase [Actinoplanes cyaneus]MCW2139829.1 Nucleoside-diphosphate-sugar epimerase [Actinoplanes cyaneus]GID67881.1 dTDP-glucose 4,6-dehydratase [Actinoplanes cyaneus]
MRIFVAGATGAVGRLLVPLLLSDGHQVTGTTRSSAGVRALTAQGATGIQVDVYDRPALTTALREAEPDVVIHQLTALGDHNLADNARIRREGTRHLVDATTSAGVRRLIVQSIAWAYQPGDVPAAEETPLDLAASGPRAQTVGGVHALETQAAEIDEHVILRYGALYGPGTWYRPGDRIGELFRSGGFTATDAVTSFLHVEDAARAAVAALGWPAGAYNIVDDEPAPARTWAPVFARTAGAPTPPVAPGRAPWERGADNTLARTKLDWHPEHPTWRTGFAAA